MQILACQKVSESEICCQDARRLRKAHDLVGTLAACIQFEFCDAAVQITQARVLTGGPIGEARPCSRHFFLWFNYKTWSDQENINLSLLKALVDV